MQPVIGAEREVFYRERAAGMYEVEPWYLALVSLLAVFRPILAVSGAIIAANAALLRVAAWTVLCCAVLCDCCDARAKHAG